MNAIRSQSIHKVPSTTLHETLEEKPTMGCGSVMYGRQNKKTVAHM